MRSSRSAPSTSSVRCSLSWTLSIWVMMSNSAKPELANSSAWLAPEIFTASSEERLKVLYFLGSAIMRGVSPLYPIDEARCKACPEPIVDVDHRDPAGAGVEHAEERREPME